MTAPSHQAVYRSSPLILGGLLGAGALLAAGLVIGLQVVAREQRLTLVIAVLGAFVLCFAVCAVTALRRHRWTIETDAVSIDERPLVPMAGRRRRRRVPFDRIAALNNVATGAIEMLALTTRDGEHFVLPPTTTGEGPARKLDDAGLADFARRLQAAMTAAGRAAPAVTDGLGFWNRPPGLALLAITLATTLGIAAVVLWGLLHGAATRVRTHDAAAMLVLTLPIAAGWLLRQSWRRRRAVLRALRQAESAPRNT